MNAALMSRAASTAMFLHRRLPAHRGEEVAAEVIDGPQSLRGMKPKPAPHPEGDHGRADWRGVVAVSRQHLHSAVSPSYQP